MEIIVGVLNHVDNNTYPNWSNFKSKNRNDVLY